jgi:hypothetical protein
MMCNEYGSCVYINNTLLSLLLTNGRNKLKCYITLGYKDFTGANNLPYRTHS